MPDATGSPLVWAAAGAAATITAGLLAKRLGAFRYQPPRVWKFNAPSGGAFAAINAPTSGARVEKALPVGEHPIQLYSLGTPNGVKVTIMLEELVAQIPTFDYDAWNIPIPNPIPDPSPNPIPDPSPNPKPHLHPHPHPHPNSHPHRHPHQVEKMGVEADEPQVQALSSALGLRLRVEYLDSSAMPWSSRAGNTPEP